MPATVLLVASPLWQNPVLKRCRPKLLSPSAELAVTRTNAQPVKIVWDWFRRCRAYGVIISQPFHHDVPGGLSTADGSVAREPALRVRPPAHLERRPVPLANRSCSESDRESSAHPTTL